ncbi:MbcA/ParS/Xre antitoxin family protein [Dyella subtropica]|uniref:MbcA/ParS/Xre antitoxin family protein n=1 Tax=Dyella subtropica TaxID=2992127 RepID=UPI0022523499|nr:MbcA/ParS/Xre antitoxin family protein [Dyella subtropica]
MSVLQAERRLRLLEIVQMVVLESGNLEDFDAAAWLDDWLRHPVPALSNNLPAEYLKSDEGCQVLIQLLGQMRSGAYA